MKLNKLIVASMGILLLSSTLSAEDKTPTPTPKATPAPTAKATTAPEGNTTTLIELDITEIDTVGYRASKILHSDVFNDEGEKIGKIEDFIVGSDSSVTFAIIGVGGFLGIPNKLVSVPTMLFTTNKKGQFELPDMSKEELNALPTFRYTR